MMTKFYFKIFGFFLNQKKVQIKLDAFRKTMKDNNYGFAVICCLVIVKRVHILSSGCQFARKFEWTLSFVKFSMNIKANIKATVSLSTEDST